MSQPFLDVRSLSDSPDKARGMKRTLAFDSNAKRVSVSLKTTQKTMETSTHAFEMLVDLIADGYRSVAARKGA